MVMRCVSLNEPRGFGVTVRATQPLQLIDIETIQLL
jgi:hypothetical protein